ncbi:glycosyltransferase [Lysinibacillus piscis]|uniref:LPS biosynthesis protein RfbU n=1 Tax=Lysinibacillus piscis TaxID=2518931 RepID=A0ABQ5NHM0_9BACI|nr:glycosyltransferase [Lysinibacillus sp. KH24]GLC87852.1 LPS biosynthesis protein RfbU [Lysinibacillus sp. KH24]
MKKILVISNMYPTSDHLSFGIFVKNQVTALEKAGVDVEVAANTNPATGKKNTILKYTKWAWKTIVKGIKYRKSIDLTHAHYVFPSGMLSLLLKKMFGIPYIVTSHGGDIERMAKKNAKIRNWTATILQESEHIIAAGPVLAEQIEQDFGIERSKISVVSMGVNREIFVNSSQEEARQKLQLASEPFIFLFVGNVIQQKGVEELLQAFQMLKTKVARPMELMIVGSRRDENFVHSLQPLVSEDVKFINPVKQQELIQYFNACDVFVLPSHLEGFGLVALEALATDTPVIASSVGGLTSLLGEGAGHLVEPKNAMALSEEMLRAMNTSKEQYMNRQAVDHVLAIHDEKNITARCIAIYESAIKGGNGL